MAHAQPTSCRLQCCLFRCSLRLRVPTLRQTWHTQLLSRIGQRGTPSRCTACIVSSEGETSRSSTGSTSLSDVNVEDFSLPLAVALGACSFEAYNLPYQMHGIKELHPCGAETIFMDADYLAEIAQGLLRVHVRHALGLKGVGEKGACNAFATVAVGPGAGRTLAVKDSTHPVWRETLFLYVRDMAVQSLTVHVEHAAREPEGRNVLLGRAEVPDLAALCDGGVHDLHLELEGDEGCCGSVDLSVLYETCAQEDGAAQGVHAKAAGQMLLDDWRPGSGHEWFDASRQGWLYHGCSGEEPELEWGCASGHELVLQTLSDASGNVFVDGVPPERPEWGEWCGLRDSAARAWGPDRLKPVAFILSRATSTEVWLYRNREAREAVIAFRGTSNPQDMMTDASLSLSAFSPGDRRESRSPEDVAAELSDEEILKGPMGPLYKNLKRMERLRLPKLPFAGQRRSQKRHRRHGAKRGGGKVTRPLAAVQGMKAWVKSQAVMLYGVEHDELWVHEGFCEAYRSVSPRVLDIIDEIIGECVNPPDPRYSDSPLDRLGRGGKRDEQWSVYLTGHSMGGALATLCAYELAARSYEHVPAPAVAKYSFGQPRVGNMPFATDYDELVPSSWRVKNANDIVTRVPSLLGYRHVGIEVQLLADGQVTISRKSSDDVREGAFAADILPKIQGGLFGEDEEAKKEFEQLAQQERQLWGTMLSGVAVKEHMEDTYCHMLRGCVERCEKEGKLPLASSP